MTGALDVWDPVPGELAPVVEVVEKLMGDHAGPLSDARPERVAALRARLGELGLWTVGVAEEYGGGGDAAAAVVVLGRLARQWAALAWGSVQAQAAVQALGPSEAWAELRAGIHAGTVPVAVADLGSAANRLEDGAGTVTATFDRVDACGPDPWVIALGRTGRAWVLPPESTRWEPLGHAGLAGACTGTVTVTAPLAADACVLDGADADAVLRHLRLGAAAVATGLATAAAEAALRYCAERRQFGGPLTGIATVRESLFLAARGAAASASTAGGASGASGAGAVAAGRACALADAACEAAVEVTARAVQLHGGYGYLAEYGVEGLLRDAVSLRAACDAAGARREGALTLVGGA